MISSILFRSIVFILCFSAALPAVENLSLRNNLARGRPGDFIVAAQNKAYTLLHIYSKQDDSLTIEEITVPVSRVARSNFSWKDWVRNGAPYHTCWMVYTVKLSTGEMRESYSLSQGGWYSVSLTETFLPTLLNLKFTPIPERDRKKVGHPLKDGGDGGRKVWQPPMMVEGQRIAGVQFNAWKAHWPRDKSPLSDKVIEIYLPQENEKYPSYFPYWLQVSGVIGKADLRVVDSGSGLVSPAPPLPSQARR